MYDSEMRKDCPMRGSLGNCSPVGGFCMDAVSDEICEAVHNAYNYGFCNALKTLKEQDAETVESIQMDRSDKWGADLTGYCPSCKRPLKNQFNNCFC